MQNAQNSDQAVNLEEIQGSIERITFHSEESGFCVLQVKANTKKKTTKDGLVTVVGNLVNVDVGEFIVASGYWFHDRNHGSQFKASSLITKQPTTLDGIEKYLASGLIKGIGKVYASKMTKAFKMDVLEVIENNPDQLRTVPGIGPKRIETIKKNWNDQKIIREIMMFLGSNKVSPSHSAKIYKKYGDKAIDIVKNNPYELAKDIRGIGFLSADKIARNLGIEEDSLIRMESAIDHIMFKISDEKGHCGTQISYLKESLIKELKIENKDNIIDQVIRNKINQDNLKLVLCNELLAVENKKNVNFSGDDNLFLPVYYAYEEYTANKLISLTQAKKKIDIKSEDLPKAVNWVESKLDITLGSDQKQALIESLTNNVCVITGGPGTGKTTMVKSLVTILRSKKLRIKLASPTGKAAKRLSQSTSMEALTIHRLLEFNPGSGGFKFNEDNNLDCDVLILDEASMIDVKIMHCIMKSLSQSTSLILIGDIDQLPSIGAGNVLKDIIESKSINTANLCEIFRQAQMSDIINNAHRINKGLFPNIKNIEERKERKSDFFFIESDDKEKINQIILKLATSRINQAFKIDNDDIQVLCPMNRGLNGAKNLNVELQKEFQKNNNNNLTVTKYGYDYKINDKVMQIANNYDKEVYNGETGIITNINAEDQEVEIKFDNRTIIYDYSELDEIQLSYAITIHKSQGSEYGAVIIPITMQSFVMLERNLIYTGITRGKKLVILIGEKKALSYCIRNKKNVIRNTRLKDLISTKSNNITK